MEHFLIAEEKTQQTRISFQQKYSSENKIKTHSNEGKLREFIANKLASKDILKDIFQTKGIYSATGKHGMSRMKEQKKISISG